MLHTEDQRRMNIHPSLRNTVSWGKQSLEQVTAERDKIIPCLFRGGSSHRSEQQVQSFHCQRGGFAIENAQGYLSHYL